MTYMSTTAECRLVLIPYSRKLRHLPSGHISHYWNKPKGTSVFTKNQENLSPLRERKFTGFVFTYLQEKYTRKTQDSTMAELAFAMVIT